MQTSRARFLTAALALALVAVFVGAGCSSDSDDDSSSDTTTETTSSSDTTGGGLTVPEEEQGTQIAVEAIDAEGTDGPMSFDVVPDSAPSGAVTFTLENSGTVEHEMIVLKTDTPYDELEVVDDKAVLDGEELGEIGHTEAGESSARTFTMESGDYVLLCNIEKHYELGMVAPFSVS